MVGRYVERRRLAGLAPLTLRNIRHVLYGFADVAVTDPSRITKRDVDRWLRLQTSLSASTRRTRHGMVNAFLGWLVTEKVLRANPMAGYQRPRVPRAAHRALDDDQARALAAEAGDLRDLLVVVLGLQMGLRVGELARLEVGDVRLSAGTVHVHGKGGHERLVPLTAEAREVLIRYLSAEGLAAGPLLRSHRRPHEGVSADRLGRIVSRLATQAGVKHRAHDGVSAHALRHTAATAIYQASGDVLAVRDVLGHQSLQTTQVYVRGMNVEGLRAAMEGRHYLAGGAARLQLDEGAADRVGSEVALVDEGGEGMVGGLAGGEDAAQVVRGDGDLAPFRGGGDRLGEPCPQPLVLVLHGTNRTDSRGRIGSPRTLARSGERPAAAGG